MNEARLCTAEWTWQPRPASVWDASDACDISFVLICLTHFGPSALSLGFDPILWGLKSQELLCRES